MVVRAHVLRQVRLEGWREKIVRRSSYRELAVDPQWFHGWTSFDEQTWLPGAEFGQRLRYRFMSPANRLIAP